MGAFARTGIVTEFSIHESYLQCFDQDIEKALQLAENSVVDSFGVFARKKVQDEYTWHIREDILMQHLRDLLKRYYADFYIEGSWEHDRSCQPVLRFLETNPSKEALKKWHDKSWGNTFHMYDSDTCDIYTKTDTVLVRTSSIRLSYEGKVSFEEFDQHLDFLEKIMRRTYADNPLGGCLMVAVS